MSWQFRSAQTLASGTGAHTTPLAVGYPASVVAGDTIFLACNVAQIGETFTISDAGFGQAVLRTTNGSVGLFWKVADGTETGSFTVQVSSDGHAIMAQTARFTGGPSSITGNVDGSNTTASISTGMVFPSLTKPSGAGRLIIGVCEKNTNGSNISIASWADGEIAESHSGLFGMCFCWNYAVQSTAASISAATMTVTTNDASALRTAVIAAFVPGASSIVVPKMGLLGVGN